MSGSCHGLNSNTKIIAYIDYNSYTKLTPICLDSRYTAGYIFHTITIPFRIHLKIESVFSNYRHCFTSFTNRIYFSSFSFYSENEYTSAVCEFSDVILDRFRFVPYHIDPIFHLSPSGFKWRRYLRILHGKSNEAIRKRRKELAEMERKGLSPTKRGKYIDFLDILLQARVRLVSYTEKLF